MFMKFYDKDNKEIIIPDSVLDNEVGFGACATIYRYDDDTCFKLYDKEGIALRYYLSTTMYEVFKEITSTSLVEIKKLLYKKENKSKYNADAYFLKYYKQVYDDLLLVPSDYLIDSLNGILNLAIEIANKGIRVDDLKRKNIILADDNIILIDPDCWNYQRNQTKKEIAQLNINNIMSLFGNIAKQNLIDNHIDFLIENNLYDYVICDKLFPLTSNKDRAMKVLSKRLNGYKRPIDYVYSLKKK